jgi:acyl transferase domain-containing protein
VTASVVDGSELGAEYWGRNLREPFLFANAIAHLIESGHDSFLEISPHPVLTGAIKQNLAHHGCEGDAIGTLARNEPERESIAKAIAALYVNGLEVDWGQQCEGEASFVKLPTYAWQRERYWYDQLPSTGLKRNVSWTKDEHALLGRRLKSAFSPGQTYWENEIDRASPHYLSDHRIGELAVLPGAAFLEMALSAMREISTANAVLGIDEAHFERLLILPEDDQRRIQTVLSPIDGGRFEFSHLQRRSCGRCPLRCRSLDFACEGNRPSACRETCCSAERACRVTTKCER